MNTPRRRRQGRGLHRAAAIGSLLVLGQSAYAETKPAAAEEGVQEMPERVMTIRSKSLRAETVSSATLTNMKTEEVPQTVNVITRDLMDSKGSDSLVEALRMDSSVNTGGDMPAVPHGGPVHHPRFCRHRCADRQHASSPRHGIRHGYVPDRKY